MRNENFLKENFQLKRGANRAKLYHRYRKDLRQDFRPSDENQQKANKTIQEEMSKMANKHFKKHLNMKISRGRIKV